MWKEGPDQAFFVHFKEEKQYFNFVPKKQDCILMTGTDAIGLMCQLMRKGEWTEHR